MARQENNPLREFTKHVLREETRKKFKELWDNDNIIYKTFCDNKERKIKKNNLITLSNSVTFE